MGASGVVYYVEDDKNIRELTVYALGQGGIEARGCANDAEFRRACAERTPDAVLLDIMLPDADGLEILAGMMEMVSRTRALLRRAGREQPHAESQSLAAGELMLWPDRREATVEGRELSLTMREFDLLEFLMRSPGVVFSRETLLQRVWGWDFDGGSRTVDVHVQQIRAKLGERSDLIETVRGVGYRVRG